MVAVLCNMSFPSTPITLVLLFFCHLVGTLLRIMTTLVANVARVKVRIGSINVFSVLDSLSSVDPLPDLTHQHFLNMNRFVFFRRLLFLLFFVRFGSNLLFFFNLFFSFFSILLSWSWSYLFFILYLNNQLLFLTFSLILLQTYNLRGFSLVSPLVPFSFLLLKSFVICTVDFKLILYSLKFMTQNFKESFAKLSCFNSELNLACLESRFAKNLVGLKISSEFGSIEFFR